MQKQRKGCRDHISTNAELSKFSAFNYIFVFAEVNAVLTLSLHYINASLASKFSLSVNVN